MREDLDEKLCKDFPNLYRDRRANMRETAMCWGFSCGDGWFDLIYEASAKLEAHILTIPEKHRALVKATQVKEKFGTLRLYMTGHNDTIDAIIREASRKSAITCEDCGKPGKLYMGGWDRTLCPTCAEKDGFTQDDAAGDDDGSEDA